MPTDTDRSRSDAVRFALLLVAWSVGIFGLLRLNATEAHVLLPLTRLQGTLALELVGAPTLPVEVTLACSGADALALCLGAVLAYPAGWRMRLAGAGVGALFILGLNTIRIGTLGRVAASPPWFNALHLYIWPAILTLAVAAYVFIWMRRADRWRPSRVAADRGTVPPDAIRREGVRFVVWAGVLLVLFALASPLYLDNAAVLSLAGFIASTAAAALSGIGVNAHATGNQLWTPRGPFLVTQECISTPLIPIYLAAVAAYATTWRQRLAGAAAVLPLFIALGVARLLIVALPTAVVASPLLVVHAFYQLLLAAVIVAVAARWRHRGRAAFAYALAGGMAAVLLVRLLGPLYTNLVTSAAASRLDDPQGAIALLPSFQLGLYVAVWVAAFIPAGWRRFAMGLAVLGATQALGLLALDTLNSSAGFTAHVRDIRGWAVAGPLVVVGAVVNVARPRR